MFSFIFNYVFGFINLSINKLPIRIFQGFFSLSLSINYRNETKDRLVYRSRINHTKKIDITYTSNDYNN